MVTVYAVHCDHIYGCGCVQAASCFAHLEEVRGSAQYEASMQSVCGCDLSGGGEKGRGVESESGGVVEILRYTSAWQVIRAYLEPAQSPLS